MGNAASSAASERWTLAEALEDLPVALKRELGGGRVFKPCLCVHDDGSLVVVKAFLRRRDAPPAEDERLGALLKARADALLALCERLRPGRLAGAPHVWPTPRVWSTRRAVVLVRQYAACSLAERATGRPFLAPPERRWVAYQLLAALAQAHAAGVCHGDVRAENCLLTSWGWLLLADFAPHKPAALPADSPAEFSLFFDTPRRGRRPCYLAPERFVGGHAAGAAAGGPLAPAADVFAAGCVIAEVYLDGEPLFDYASLLAYRAGTYDPAPAIAAIPDAGVAALVAHMTARDPGARAPAAAYLAGDFAGAPPRGALFPPAFGGVLHPFFSAVLALPPDARADAAAAAYPRLRAALLGARADAALPRVPADVSPRPAAAAAGEGAERGAERGAEEAGPPPPAEAAGDPTLQEVAAAQAAAVRGIQAGLEGGAGGGGPAAAAEGEPAAAASPPPPAPAAAAAAAAAAPATAPAGADDGGLLVLLLPLLCTALRGARLPSARARAAWLLADAAAACGDDAARLDRAVPYLLRAAADAGAPPAARAAALRGLAAVARAAATLPPGEARGWGDYLLPSLSTLPGDADAGVRAAYAAALPALAASGTALLQAGAARGALAALRAGAGRAAHELLVGAGAAPRAALLAGAAPLAAALGRRDAADVLLPPLLTLFNAREWRVREALCARLAGACAGLGPAGFAAVALPLLDRALEDAEPAVAAAALGCLADAAAAGLLPRRHLLAAAARAAAPRGALAHASTAVRAAAARYVAAAAAALPAGDARALLLPRLAPALAREPLAPGDPRHVAAAMRCDGLALVRPPAPPAPGGAPSTPRASERPLHGRPGSGGAAPVLSPGAASVYDLPLPEPARRSGGESALAAALRAAAPEPGRGAGPPAARAGEALAARARRRPAHPLPGEAPTPGGGAAARRAAARLPFNLTPAPPAPAAAAAAQAAGAPAAGAAAGGGATGGGGAGGWYPRGVLVAHLAEHRRGVTRLAAAPGCPCFVSASADGTARVWDAAGLEGAAPPRSRFAYAGHGGGGGGAAVTAAALLDGGAGAAPGAGGGWAAATGCAAGLLRVWPLDGGGGAAAAAARRLDPADGAVRDLAAWRGLLLRATSRGGVAAWDLRAARDAWALPAPPAGGAAERFAADPGAAGGWLVSATSRGALALWDVRFLLPVRQWRLAPGGGAPAALAAAAAPPARLGLGGAAAAAAPAGAPLVFVAAGEGEAALWDAAAARPVLVLRAAPRGGGARREPPAALAAAGGGGGGADAWAGPPPPPLPPPRGGGADAAARARRLGLAELAQGPARARDAVRALLPTPGGQLLTGGDDRALRCFDCARPERGLVVAAPPPALGDDGGGPAQLQVPSYSYSVREEGGVRVVEERCVLAPPAGGDDEAWAHRAAALCHRQGVADLAALAPAASGGAPLLLSGGADGIVKVWR